MSDCDCGTPGFNQNGSGLVKISSSDTTANFLATKLVAGTNVTLVPSGPGNQTLTVNAAGTALDHKVTVSAADTTPGFLNAKALAGAGITITLENPGANEDLKFSAPGIAIAQAAADTAQATANARLASFDGRTATAASDIVASLAALAALAGSANGSRIFVVDQAEFYTLDTTNAFTASSPLIIAANGGGRWFRRSKAYVVGNFTLWGAPIGGTFTGTGDSKLGGFTPGQLAASNANAPDIILDLVAAFPIATNTVYGAITDNLGNLWVIGLNNAKSLGTIQKFLLKDCLVSGSPTPSLAINFTPPTVVHAIAIAFDKQNNLWLAVGDHGTFGKLSLFKYNQPSYSVGSTNQSPDITITLFGTGVAANTTSDVGTIIFDSEGNLWAAVGFTGNNGGNSGGVIMIAANQLTSSNASLVPSVYWAGTNFPTGGAASFSIQDVALAPTGLLWVANYAANNLKAYDPRSPSSGNPAPLIIITSAILNGPVSMCFDSTGNLWVANDNDQMIFKYTPAQITATGAPVPTVVLSQTTILAFPYSITFPMNPNKSGLLPSGVPITQ